MLYLRPGDMEKPWLCFKKGWDCLAFAENYAKYYIRGHCCLANKSSMSTIESRNLGLERVAGPMQNFIQFGYWRFHFQIN